MFPWKMEKAGGSNTHLCDFFHGRYDLPRDRFFSLPSCSHFRGHDLKLRYRSFHLARRIVTSYVRLVERLNKLPAFVITSPSMPFFMNRHDVCWETIYGLDTLNNRLHFYMDSNFSCWWALFGPRNLRITWDRLYQTDLDRGFVNFR